MFRSQVVEFHFPDNGELNVGEKSVIVSLDDLGIIDASERVRNYIEQEYNIAVVFDGKQVPWALVDGQLAILPRPRY